MIRFSWFLCSVSMMSISLFVDKTCAFVVRRSRRVCSGGIARWDCLGQLRPVSSPPPPSSPTWLKSSSRSSSSSSSSSSWAEKRQMQQYSSGSPSEQQQLQRSIISSKNNNKAYNSNSNNDQQHQQQNKNHQPPLMNLYTISKEDLQDIIQSWGYPRYRADQVYHWIREKGIVDVEQMNNIPKKLRHDLQLFSSSSSSATTGPAAAQDDVAHTTTTTSRSIGKLSVENEPNNNNISAGGALEMIQEQVSVKDGTIKRLYKLRDGFLIESVLMPYEDGRWTSCISSQAGCAQGCVFCATGQQGFQRQLTADEIVEQVTRFSTYLKSSPLAGEAAATQSNLATQERKQQSNKQQQQQRLSNIVFMGEGEPLANFKNVMEAVPRIQELAGIGARRITISTVGVVPNIRKLMESPIQVRLAVSLHCASDEERSALLPANRRYGGLNELMTTLHDYIETTGRRLTLEWALIEGENDTPEVAKKLGNLLRTYKLRRDMVHINVIPLNPTGGYKGSASGRKRVNEFIRILEEEFGVACTPRVRRGIDIDAGCGQLKSKALLGGEESSQANKNQGCGTAVSAPPSRLEAFSLDGTSTIDLDSDDDILYDEDGEILDETFDPNEAARILDLVKGTVVKGESEEKGQLRP